MFDHDLFKLNAGLADGLQSLNGLKNLAVRAGQYEYAAKLRDIEKHLECAQEEILCMGYPVDTYLQKNAKGLFYKQLFGYAGMNDWELPPIFADALAARKAVLNENIAFDDAATERLIALNWQLTIHENRLTDFFNFIKYVLNIRGMPDSYKELSAGSLVMKCYSGNGKYSLAPNPGGGVQSPFYQLKLPVQNLLSDAAGYYENGDAAANALFRLLPLTFNEERICFPVFYFSK